MITESSTTCSTERGVRVEKPYTISVPQGNLLWVLTKNRGRSRPVPAACAYEGSSLLFLSGHPQTRRNPLCSSPRAVLSGFFNGRPLLQSVRGGSHPLEAQIVGKTEQGFHEIWYVVSVSMQIQTQAALQEDI